MPHYLASETDGAVPLVPVSAADYPQWLSRQPQRTRSWLEAAGFAAKPGSVARVPDGKGGLAQVVVGIDEAAGLWAYGDLAAQLTAGTYRIERRLDAAAATRAACGWALGTYRFARYKEQPKELATLVWPDDADRDATVRTVEAVFLARDLINTPASDLGPDELEQAARALAKKHRAKITVISGDDLLKQNYPTIHTVGRASTRAPRLIDLGWGKSGAPKVTLVGKGVCFDTGGLDIKPSSGMRNMKKDMGGAANMLALAHMVMAAKLPVRLRLLVPAVENSIAGNAMRPLDVIRTRKGLTVEVGNTDAEGRLILCDALAEADTEKPDLILDAATLTGAARVALGPDLPALFSNDDDLAAGLLRHGEAESDPMWRMPLHAGYRKMLDSDVADMNNVSEGGFAGAVTAALFLQAFVSKETKWAHLDMFAWNQSSRPGRPRGGEAQAIRAAFAMLRERYPG